MDSAYSVILLLLNSSHSLQYATEYCMHSYFRLDHLLQNYLVFQVLQQIV